MRHVKKEGTGGRKPKTINKNNMDWRRKPKTIIKNNMDWRGKPKTIKKKKKVF